MRRFAAAALIVGLGAGTAQAELLVYEGFDYTVGSDVTTPLNGGIGFTGAWVAGEEGGTITVADATDASWDGVMTNLPTTPGDGNHYISGASGDSRITAKRTLSQSAGALAGDDNVLWGSIVWRMDAGNFGRQVGFTLGTNGLANRSVNIDGSGDGIGVGGGFNSSEVTPVVFDEGNVVVRDTTAADSLSLSQENLVILKFVFADGAGLDRVYAWSYLDSELPTLTEATFDTDTAASFAEFAIDQDTLNVLSFSQSQVSAEAIDEIRLGDTFADMFVVPEPSSLALLGLGGLLIGARRRRG